MANLPIRLSDYSTTPLYNIKAVVQATGISPSTLRAWERRYHMFHPQRSGSGYRLYSDRDVAIIRWLKAQVDGGMAISHAVAWLANLGSESEAGRQGVLPATGVVESPFARSSSVRSLEAIGNDLITALTNFDEEEAEQLLAEAFALYTIEQVGEDLVVPVLIEIGERWHRKQLSVTREHFASNYLLQRLATILRTVPNVKSGPLVWVGCAPGEEHEGAAVLLAIYLRRAGYQVHYLGQNLPGEDFVDEVHKRRPEVVVLSAGSAAAADALRDLAERLASNGAGRPLLAYGGRIFVSQPEWRNAIQGAYLGDTTQAAILGLHALLHPASAAGKSDTPESEDD